MISAYLAYKFAGLWALVWHFGIGGVLALGCLAAAYFSPVFKKEFLWAAALIVAVMVAVGIGVHLGEQRINAQWAQARANAVDNGKKARAGAVRDVARKPSRWLPNHRDPYDRDGH
jgi:hypothetical protein